MTDKLFRCEVEVDELTTRLRVELAGRLDAIPAAVEQIMAVVNQTKSAQGNEFEIEIALNEALANAVKHGCRLDPAKTVEASILCDQEAGVWIVVRDPGRGFEATDVPSPIADKELYASHGRGIFLINRLMDEVHYGAGGTEIRMRKAPRDGSNPAEVVVEPGDE